MLLGVSELEIAKIHLIVRDLRSHASVLPEPVSLVEIGVDADLDEVEHRIKGVRAKLLKVRLDNARHPRPLPGHRGGATASVAGAVVRATGGVVGLATGVVGGALEGAGPTATGISQDTKAAHEESRTDDTNEGAGGLVYEERYADYDVHDRGGERLDHVDALFIDEDGRST